jgi:hypothetical protein
MTRGLHDSAATQDIAGLPDAAARTRFIQAFDASLSVEAGAGAAA